MFPEIKRYFETHNLDCQINYRNNHLEDVQRKELQEILWVFAQIVKNYRNVNGQSEEQAILGLKNMSQIVERAKHKQGS